MANKLKLPMLTKESRLLSFDLETNALHGQAFAVGAVVINASGRTVDSFTGRTKIIGQVDEWVSVNILPAISDMPVNYPTYIDMREAFWRWFQAALPNCDYVVVNNGYPVEYRFLLDCQEADLEERYWQHPFPILDLTSLLIQVGQQNRLNKNDFVKEFLEGQKLKAHHPLQDATAAALAAFKAFRLAGQIN